jgi:predicted nucleic acid-binding protein
VSGYLADTSVFIAAEQRRPLGRPPEGDARISVATLTELGVGVRMATGEELGELRRLTLARAQRFVALPYDELVAVRLADILAEAGEQGGGARGQWTRLSLQRRSCTISKSGHRTMTSRFSRSSIPPYVLSAADAKV